jgi:hypothetical protein
MIVCFSLLSGFFLNLWLMCKKYLLCSVGFVFPPNHPREICLENKFEGNRVERIEERYERSAVSFQTLSFLYLCVLVFFCSLNKLIW